MGLPDDQKWCRVSIRVESETLAPDDVTRRLGIMPTFEGRKGEHRQNNSQYAQWEMNLWGWNGALPAEIPAADLIEEALNLVEDRRVAWLEMLADSTTSAELFIGYSSANGQGGFILTPDHLLRMANLKLHMGLDLYPSSCEQASSDDVSTS